jgi:putative membrane protein
MDLILNYAAYVALSIALLVVAGWLYCLITPYDEIALIRKGNEAAALSFSGTLVGIAAPLASVMANSTSMIDMLIWSAIALVAQLALFVAVTWLLGDLRTGITEGRRSYGILLGSASIAVGLLNAGAVTY